MKKYFYSDGKEKHGPLSLDELQQEGISNGTLIWFEGLDGQPGINEYGYNPKG